MGILAEGDQKLRPTHKLDCLGFVGIHAQAAALQLGLDCLQLGVCQRFLNESRALWLKNGSSTAVAQLSVECLEVGFRIRLQRGVAFRGFRSEVQPTRTETRAIPRVSLARRAVRMTPPSALLPLLPLSRGRGWAALGLITLYIAQMREKVKRVIRKLRIDQRLDS
jgi:hypothetical protein